MDTTGLTIEEVEVLNSFITPEVYECLLQGKRDKDRDAREEEELMEMAQITLNSLSDVDTESIVDEVLELQERMGKGIELIKSINIRVTARFKENSYMGLIYWAMFKADKEDTRAGRVLRHPNNQEDIKLLSYRKRLWDHWWVLKNKCSALAKDNTSIWPTYFSLEKEEINEYFTYGINEDETEVDDRMVSSIDAYMIAHIEQQREVSHVIT